MWIREKFEWEIADDCGKWPNISSHHLEESCGPQIGSQLIPNIEVLFASQLDECHCQQLVMLHRGESTDCEPYE